MYDLRQFKPVLYILVLLSIIELDVSAQGSAVCVLGIAGVLLNAALVYRGRFTPFPRWLSNIITLTAAVFFSRGLARGDLGRSILLIGEFLTVLQLIKLYEQRSNRDYAQLLVLSVLLMVAASINTGSLISGLLLIVYLIVALYCALLFHLKVEADHAFASSVASGFAPATPDPTLLSQAHCALSRSMRRITAVIAVVSITTAVLVFLFFPRSSSPGFFGDLSPRPPEALQAFSDHVSFNQVARITQSSEQVAYVKVWKNEVPVEGTASLRLRGVTLEHYANAATLHQGWQWYSAPGPGHFYGLSAGETVPDLSAGKSFPPMPPGDRWRQRIMLRPTGTNVIFALPGMQSFTPDTELRVQYQFEPQTLRSDETLRRSLEYEVVSRNELLRRPLDFEANRARPRGSPFALTIDPRIQAYARRPDVAGALAAQRDPHVFVDPLDERIAAAIAQHLKTKFTYTLDLTDAGALLSKEDPLVTFLYTLKRGHCEYFAGAMALMCQSLGMQARVVVGFVSDEYNGVGGYYIVRQSDAHAWVEVLTFDHGWQTFDPTSSNIAASTTFQTVSQAITHFFNFLEYQWATTVVAYDNQHRQDIMAAMERIPTRGAYESANAVNNIHHWWDHVRAWFDSAQFWLLSSKLLALALGLVITAMIAAVGWYVLERWKIHRRATRIGLDSLPRPVQMDLARQLGFYEDLTRLLERAHAPRPRHSTPREFSRSLTFLPADAYLTITRLTEIYYRVRYGGIHLTHARQRHLTRTVHVLADGLPPQIENQKSKISTALPEPTNF